MKYIVSFDVGGTNIKYGLLDEKGNFIDKSIIPTDALHGGKNVVDKLCVIIKNYSDTYPLSGVAVSTAGVVNSQTGEIIHAGATMPDYEGINIKKIINEKFSLPCEVENDVNCVGLAEYAYGAAQNYHSAVCIAIGTGIGGCYLQDGKILSGATFSVCEFGYIPMQYGDTTHLWENIASTRALREYVADCKHMDVRDWTGEKIFQEAENGDEDCKIGIGRMMDALGRGIATICYVLNPEVVVIGGAIVSQGDKFLMSVRKHVSKYLIPFVYKETKIMLAENQNDAGMLGAFYNFFN